MRKVAKIAFGIGLCDDYGMTHGRPQTVCGPEARGHRNDRRVSDCEKEIDMTQVPAVSDLSSECEM